MKFMENSQKNEANAQTKEEAKEIIKNTVEEAGMVLDDAELDEVSGGAHFTNVGSRPM